MEKKRINWIDFAKGITIFLVVFGHINSGLLNSGKFQAYDNILSLIYDFVGTLRMPLFFMVSGFLYYTKLNSNLTDLKKSILKKFIALGIPYLIFSVLTWIVKFTMGGNVRVEVELKDLLLIPIVPIEHFWFLYVLLIIFVLTELFDYYFKNNYIVLSIIFAIAIVRWNFHSGFYLLDKSMSMMIFFYMGKMLRQNINVLKNSTFVLLCFLTFVALEAAALYNDISYSGIGFIVSVTGVLFILAASMRLNDEGYIYRYFSEVGRITMPVYLLHPSIASMTRMVLFKFGIGNIIVHFILGVVVAWCLSIFIYRIAAKNKYADFLFYPAKYWKV